MGRLSRSTPLTSARANSKVHRYGTTPSRAYKSKDYLIVHLQIGKNAGAGFRRIESLYGIITKDIHA